MSGAEAALAVVGIVANVAQIVAFSVEVIERVKWCIDQRNDAPQVLKEIRAVLPSLTDTLKQAEENAKAKVDESETDDALEARNKALLDIIEKCKHEMAKLQSIVTSVIPKADDSKAKRAWLGLRTINKDSKMDRIRDRLQEYVGTISNHQQAYSTSLLIAHVRDQRKIQPEMMMLLTRIYQRLQTPQTGHVQFEELRTLIIRQSQQPPQGQQPNQVIVDKLEAIFAQIQKNAEAAMPPPEPIKEAGKDVNSGFSNIPLKRRVEKFVRRDRISLKIEDKFADPANTKRTVVLQGMGGNGKTQLAIDFALLALEDALYDSVFWVDATSEASAQRSLQEIAEKLTDPAPKFETDKQRIEFVERRLNNWNGNFLLILDNYDNVSAFKTHQLPAFMPHCSSSHFLITSRLSPDSPDLDRLCSFIVEVGGMEPAEAEELLLRRAYRDGERPNSDSNYSVHAKTLVARLGYHALAIDLSAAYILEKKVPIDHFVSEFDTRKKEILNRPPSSLMWEYQRKIDDKQEQETNLAVFTSWELSYKLLPEDENGYAAAELLNLLAFLYRQGVSEELFWKQHKHLGKDDALPEWLLGFLNEDDDQWNRSRFENALVELSKLSLIASYDHQGSKIKGITLHPLVQDWIKIRLGAEKQRSFTIEATNIVHRFLESQRTEVETFEMSVEHKPEALSYVVVCQENIAEFCKGREATRARPERAGRPGRPAQPAVPAQPALAAQRLGEGELVGAGETFALFLEYMGKVSEAEGLFQTIINWRELHSKEDDRDLLRARSLYSEILRLQKSFREAEKLDRGVYDIRKKLLGNDLNFELETFDWAAFHMATLEKDPQRLNFMKEILWSAHDLGWDLEALGNVEEAEKLQRLAYNGRTEILGENNPLSLQSINNLAHTLRRQGKTLEALKLMKKTLNIGLEVFQTPHHSELLQFMSKYELTPTLDLQDVLRFQGQLEDAETMAEESLKATCAEWGENHLKAAASRGQLKDILWDLGKSGPAEEIATENLEIMSESPYSTDISRIDDIALLLDTLSGRQMTASDPTSERRILKYAEQALELVKKLEKEQERRDQDAQDQAKNRKQKVEKGSQKDAPGPLTLPSTIQDLVYLATGLEVLRASKQLITLEPIIYKYSKKVFGMSDRTTINSLVRYSSALRVEGDQTEANRTCQEAIDELRKELEQGKNDGTKSTHLAALSWLAVLYKHIGNRRKAMEVYDQAFDYVNLDGGAFIRDADYETLYSIQGLAEDIDDQRRCQKAEFLHKAVLKTRRDRYQRHPCVDDSLYAYSWNLRLQDRLVEAEKVCQEALDIAREFRGPHRNTMCILKRLAYLEEQLGKHEEAEAHYREVLDGFRRLGTRHMTRVTEALEDLQELLMEQRKWREARDLIQDAINRRSNGWDRNMGHHAGLIRHLAIVTWELGDGIEGLRLYRKARKTYEQAWGLHKMPEGPQKQNLIRRINELLPGTENMEEEMRIEKEESEAAASQKIANDASAKKNADLDAADDGQKTPTQADTPKQTVKEDLKLGLGQVNQSLASHGATQVTYDGKTNQFQTSTKSNEEATANYDAPDVSLSRSSTLGVNSFPEAPGNEPSKLDNEDPTVLAGITRQMEQATMNAA